jgi:ATP-dependent Clp protease adaptor protein ClpS
MKSATSVDPAFEEFLHALYVSSREKKLKTITIERALAALIEMPRVAEFLTSRLQPVSVKALRDDLHEVLLRESVAESFADVTESRWRYRLSGGLKSLLRRSLPNGVPFIDNWLDDGPEVTEEFNAVLTKAFVRVFPGRNLKETDFFLSIIENAQGAASAVLQTHGITRFDLVCYLAHGSQSSSAYSELALSDAGKDVRLFLLNDDFTPMEFVVEVLETIFAMPSDDAKSVMTCIHENGRAACGTFPLSIASEKLRQVAMMAVEHQHPLRGSLEIG